MLQLVYTDTRDSCILALKYFYLEYKYTKIFFAFLSYIYNFIKCNVEILFKIKHLDFIYQ